MGVTKIWSKMLGLITTILLHCEWEDEIAEREDGMGPHWEFGLQWVLVFCSLTRPGARRSEELQTKAQWRTIPLLAVDVNKPFRVAVGERNRGEGLEFNAACVV